jgi:hypothetical protein
VKPAKKERVYLRVINGGLVPADDYAASRLREKAYKVGDVLAAQITKLRNPRFNRLVHRIGQLVVANIDAFDGLDAHTAIKRLQMEGRIACDEIGILVPDYGMVVQVIPRSLSFDTMDEGEYHEVARAICRLIAQRYWTKLTPEQIEQMAESFVMEAA